VIYRIVFSTLTVFVFSTVGLSAQYVTDAIAPRSPQLAQGESAPIHPAAMGAAVAGESEAKSGFLGVLYSMVLPGMGEMYAGRMDRGMYPLITEAGLWLGLIGVNTYGSWVRDDARTFARQHAGVDPAGKEDEFWVHIENYRDLHDYNNQRLIERRLDELYPDEPSFQWQWDSESSRKYYKDRRILSDEMSNAVSFFVLGMVANRIWSAIQAGVFVRRHNATLEQRAALLPSMRSSLVHRMGRVDELRFTFTW